MVTLLTFPLSFSGRVKAPPPACRPTSRSHSECTPVRGEGGRREGGDEECFPFCVESECMSLQHPARYRGRSEEKKIDEERRRR